MALLPNTELELPVASHSTASVARRLGVSIPTVQRWVDQGHLKAWKTVGGHRRIDAASVETFIQRRAPQDLDHTDNHVPAVAPSVLIVDDNPDDRDLLATLVEAALPGAIVMLAESGFEGLLTMGHQTPDILITDIVMPNMNGFEMLRHVATQLTSRPKILIAVSSRTPTQFAEMGPLPDDVQFLPKPIDPARLMEVLVSTAGSTGLLAR